MSDKIVEKIDSFVLATSAGTWIVIVGAAIALGKKAADFVYSATIGKFRLDIGKIVEEKIVPLQLKVEQYSAEVEKYEEEVRKYRDQHHGVIAKNESVLLQTLEINSRAFEKLDQFNKILNSKL